MISLLVPTHARTHARTHAHTHTHTHTHTFAASFALIIFSLDFSSRSSSNCLRSILNQSNNLLIQASLTHPPKSLLPTLTFHSHLFPSCTRQTLPAIPAVPPSPPQVETWVQRAELGRVSSPRTQQATGERHHATAFTCKFVWMAQQHSFLTNGSGVDWATISLYMSRCLTTASTCACMYGGKEHDQLLARHS